MSDTTATSCCTGAGQPVAVADAQSMADVLGALADPVRLQILSIIARSSSGEVCACDFVGPIERSQPTISHHLKILAEAGLITGDKRGRWIWYRTVPGRIAAVHEHLDAIAG